VDSRNQEIVMSEIVYVTEENFQTEVIAASQPVVVDFTAVWCGPCKMLEPVVKELASEWEGKAKVVKLDVDHAPNLAMQYQVMGVPTLMLFSGGEPKERLTGYQPKKRIQKKFDAYLE
jgi:thioredoxin 1